MSINEELSSRMPRPGKTASILKPNWRGLHEDFRQGKESFVRRRRRSRPDSSVSFWRPNDPKRRGLGGQSGAQKEDVAEIPGNCDRRGALQEQARAISAEAAPGPDSSLSGR